MQDTGEHLFTRAGRAGQQGGDFGLRHPLRQHQQLLAHRIGKNKRLWLHLDWHHQRLHVGPVAHIKVIRGQHVLGTVTHGSDRQLKRATIRPADHRQIQHVVSNQTTHPGKQVVVFE